MSVPGDDKNKTKYSDFINKCHDIAVLHEDYCNNNCFKDNTIGWYPHTKICIKMRNEHHESFVECNSIFCLKMNEIEGIRPSYVREEPKQDIITELTYYDDDD